ncbi:MAG: replication-relaxation family protein [Mycobacteriales bacterium]
MTETYVTSAQLQRVRDQLIPLDQALIDTLAIVDYATSDQLQRLVLPRTSTLARARRVRRRLQHLRERRVVYTLERRIGGYGGGSPQSIHTLDRAGLQLTSSTHPRRVRPARDRGRAHVNHALDVTQHRVDLDTYAATHDGVRVVLWQGEPGCHVPFRELGRLARLSQDALVTVDTPTERITSMLEVDRDTHSLPTLLQKADRYLGYAAPRPETPQVVISMTNPGRAERLATALHHPHRPPQLSQLAQQLFVITTRKEAIAALAGQEVAT